MREQHEQHAKGAQPVEGRKIFGVLKRLVVDWSAGHGYPWMA
jgi:hypothetical protein